MPAWVKLLENVAQQQREGEADNVAGDVTLGHIHVPFAVQGEFRQTEMTGVLT